MQERILISLIGGKVIERNDILNEKRDQLRKLMTQVEVLKLFIDIVMEKLKKPLTEDSKRRWNPK